IGFTPAGASGGAAYAQGIVQKALQKTFSPEFLNRIDEIVYFESLQKESIIQIIDTEWTPIQTRVEKMGYNIELTDGARNFLADKGYDVQYGARPIKRMMQKHVEDVVATTLLEGVPYGSTLHIELNETQDGTVCRTTPGAQLPLQNEDKIEANNVDTNQN
ncbi:MAG: ATP-dependent Clp protease ATP-binding subunit, partial [Paludibacteraceae bacterium]|nr:ATP-dependent Clp protease ATP-binding subunit [Paludibacteraceae bacterium]